jgi:hypothetical protein
MYPNFHCSRDSAQISPSRANIASVTPYGTVRWFDTSSNVPRFQAEDLYTTELWHLNYRNKVTCLIFLDETTIITGTEGGKVNIHLTTDMSKESGGNIMTVDYMDFLPPSHIDWFLPGMSLSSAYDQD